MGEDPTPKTPEEADEQRGESGSPSTLPGEQGQRTQDPMEDHGTNDPEADDSSAEGAGPSGGA